MRKAFFISGWIVLLALPLFYAIDVYVQQDLPSIAPWQWAVPVVAVLMIYLSRNRDDVLKHHLI
jgi:hypothetical protein